MAIPREKRKSERGRKPDRKSGANQAQSGKFIEMAKTAIGDYEQDAEERFQEALRRVATAKPTSP